MQGEMDSTAIRLLLNSHNIGRIGCVHHGQPYIFPVNYAFDGSNIFCQSDEGVKLNILRGHHRVCFQVDAVVNAGFWQSILAVGVFKELSGPEAASGREKLYNRMFAKSRDFSGVSAEAISARIERSGKHIKKIMFRIELEDISGRYEHPARAVVAATQKVSEQPQFTTTV